MFYPFAFSGICTSELREIRDNLGDFVADDVQVAHRVVRPDVQPARLGRQRGLLLSAALATSGRTGRSRRRTACSRPAAASAIRGTFLIDLAGVMRWTQVNEPGQKRDFDGLAPPWRRCGRRRVTAGRRARRPDHGGWSATMSAGRPRGPRACSSAGRAPRLHRGCRRFDPGRAHPTHRRPCQSPQFLALTARRLARSQIDKRARTCRSSRDVNAARDARSWRHPSTPARRPVPLTRPFCSWCRGSSGSRRTVGC